MEDYGAGSHTQCTKQCGRVRPARWVRCMHLTTHKHVIWLLAQAFSILLVLKSNKTKAARPISASLRYHDLRIAHSSNATHTCLAAS